MANFIHDQRKTALNIRAMNIEYVGDILCWLVLGMSFRKKLLFSWHTLNISFSNLNLANQYLDEVKVRNEICENPLEWNEKEQRFIKTYPCKANFIRVK